MEMICLILFFLLPIPTLLLNHDDFFSSLRPSLSAFDYEHEDFPALVGMNTAKKNTLPGKLTHTVFTITVQTST